MINNENKRYSNLAVQGKTGIDILTLSTGRYYAANCTNLPPGWIAAYLDVERLDSQWCRITAWAPYAGTDAPHITKQCGGVWQGWEYLITNNDNVIKSIGATTSLPSYPYRCQIRRSGKIGICSYYGKWSPSTGDPIILHMLCSITTVVDFAAAGSDGKSYYGYAYENGDVHLIANTSGSDINVFFSFSFTIAE